MELTILGSGTTDPTLKRHEPGYLLKIGKDLILLDVGTDTKMQIANSGNNGMKVNNVLISHTHCDHVSGLPALFWRWWVANKGTPITILGPKGTKKFIQKMGAAFFPKFEEYFNFSLKVKEMHNSTYRTKTWKVKSVYTWRQGHTSSPYALAYRIEHKGKALVYGADMCYDYPKSIVQIAKNADVLLIEAAVPESRKYEDHLTPGRAGQLAAEANVKKLILTHFYFDTTKYNIKAQVKKHFKGQIVIAKDLMKIKI